MRKIKKTRELSAKQIIFVEEHFVNGESTAEAARRAGYGKNAAVIGNSLAKSQNVLRHVAKIAAVNPLTAQAQHEVLAAKFANHSPALNLQESFEWKIGKLVKIINLNVPDDENNISSDPGSVKRYQFGAALGAIAELNKMQGHYAPSKSVNLDIKADADIKKMLELSNKLLLEYHTATDDKF